MLSILLGENKTEAYDGLVKDDIIQVTRVELETYFTFNGNFMHKNRKIHKLSDFILPYRIYSPATIMNSINGLPPIYFKKTPSSQLNGPTCVFI